MLHSSKILIFFFMLKCIEDLDDFFLSFMPEGGAVGSIRENRLERMESLLDALSHPEREYRTIHLAGSKGKGTTATILSSAINTHFKTGLFRSPHVYDTRERFTLSGRFFSDEEYLEAAKELEEKVMKLDFSPTTFELYTAFAYILFRNTRCSYAVIETGLGGRLDATNTIDSIMEILLPIELEHTAVLGDTIEKIAVEKSKIIKKNSIVIISDVERAAYDVFEREAESLSCPVYSFRSDIHSFSHHENEGESHTEFEMNGKRYKLDTKLRSAEIGKNFAIASLALDKLGLLTEESVKAMESLKLEGRFEERRKGEKSIVLDVAHTKNSMRNLIETYTELYESRKTTVIYSSLEGKDHSSMLSLLLSRFDRIIITKAGSFKKSDPDALYREAMELKKENQMVYLIHDERKALEMAERISDCILITGSFYLVGMFGENNA